MIEAVVFDAYGTLFDVQSVATACDAAFPGYGERVSTLWRQKQLEYTWLRALMRRYVDFAGVNRDSLTYTLEALNLWFDEQTLTTLLSTYLELPAFPEVPAALHSLRTVPRSILSNGTEAMLRGVVQHAGLLNEFQYILSVDSLETYKPDQVVYAHAENLIGVPKSRILFVSSNGWDVAGAKAFGFTVAWVNRKRVTREELGEQPDFEVANLSELVQQLRL